MYYITIALLSRIMSLLLREVSTTKRGTITLSYQYVQTTCPTPTVLPPLPKFNTIKVGLAYINPTYFLGSGEFLNHLYDQFVCIVLITQAQFCDFLSKSTFLTSIGHSYDALYILRWNLRPLNDHWTKLNTRSLRISTLGHRIIPRGGGSLVSGSLMGGLG